MEDYCRADCENSDLSDDQKRLCVQGCLLTEAEHFPAMTTEPRPVVPGMEELRERLAETYYRLRWADGSWSWLAPQHKAPYYELVDALLAEIAAAGLSIVASDRLNRLEAALQVFADNRVIGPRGDVGSVEELLLRPGDLEPLAGGDR